MDSIIIGGRPAIITFVLRTSLTGKRLIFISCLFKSKDYQVKEEDHKMNIDWKKNMKLGIQIKQNWGSLNRLKKIMFPNFAEDCKRTCEELYNSLKDLCSLPKLRKENLFVENDLNSFHQKFMYDFLYDQQEIYDHYEDIFEDKKKMFNHPINVRQPTLPFATTLENFDDVLLEFSEEKDMQSLANLRFYIFQSSLDNCNRMSDDNYGNQNDDVLTIFSTTCTETFSAKMTEEFHNRNPNHLMSLLNSIVLTITFFSKMSYNYIIQYLHNDQLFLDCFIKRYSAYVECAIYMNEQLENLNVLVNYLYETLYKDYPKNPKFSFYRLMIIIWHREVTTPLTDLKQEKNLVNVILKVFKRFLTAEVNKLHGCDVRINRAKSGSSPKFHSENNQENCLILDCHSDDGDLSFDHMKENQFDNSQFYPFNPLNCSLGNNFSICMTDTKSSILEDIYTHDFQAKYFLEQIPCILLDTICNEYSTFYINDSQFPISQSYQVLEINMIKIFEKFITTYFAKQNKLNLIRYLKNGDFINNKLINKSKNRLFESISKIIIDQCEQEITLIFRDYLVNNFFSEDDADRYFKAFDSFEDKQNPLHYTFLIIAREVFRNDLLSEYATLYFMREITRSRNHLFLTLIETKEWLEEEMLRQRNVDRQVRKENKRRNIQLDGDVYQHQLFNFTPNFSFQHILEIYGIEGESLSCSSDNHFKQSNKRSEDIIMNNYEEMATFPQTFDAQMNFNMDIEINFTSR